MYATRAIILGIFAALMVGAGMGLAPLQAAAEGGLSKGQLVYVPLYSHVYYGDRGDKLLLTGILSIRNTDPAHPLTVTRVDYFDSEGNLIRKYVSQPVILKPLAATRFIVKESDTLGGSGASFLVKWEAERPINEPLLEGVMIGTVRQQGISFTSRGRVLQVE